MDYPGESLSRPKVLAEGWSDADIDRIIKEERKAVHQPRHGMRLIVDTNVFVSAALKSASWPATTLAGSPATAVCSRATTRRRADAMLSGDADLLALDTFRDIPIITPAAFVRAQVR